MSSVDRDPSQVHFHCANKVPAKKVLATDIPFVQARDISASIPDASESKADCYSFYVNGNSQSCKNIPKIFQTLHHVNSSNEKITL